MSPHKDAGSPCILTEDARLCVVRKDGSEEVTQCFFFLISRKNRI